MVYRTKNLVVEQCEYIVEIEGKWFYVDDTCNYEGKGPFDTEESAKEALGRHLKYLKTGET